MQFHDEIEKLQARVTALEEKFGGTDAPAPAEAAPVEYTREYLDTLTVDAIGDLYRAGKIDTSQLGAAVTRKVFPAGVPPEFEDDFGSESEAEAEPQPEPETPATEVVEPAAEVATAIATPEPVDDAQIAAQNEHDRATGNVNEAGQTPAEAVEAEAAAPVADDAGLES